MDIHADIILCQLEKFLVFLQVELPSVFKIENSKKLHLYNFGNGSGFQSLSTKKLTN